MRRQNLLQQSKSAMEKVAGLLALIFTIQKPELSLALNYLDHRVESPRPFRLALEHAVAGGTTARVGVVQQTGSGLTLLAPVPR